MWCVLDDEDQVTASIKAKSEDGWTKLYCHKLLIKEITVPIEEETEESVEELNETY